MNLPDPFVDGVNVCGYLRAEIGLGGAARGYVAALKAAGIPVALNDVTDIMVGLPGDVELPGEAQETNPYRVNLIVAPAHNHEHIVQRVGEAYFEDRYNIGVWFWELGELPEEQQRVFPEYDEIWAGSTFIADTLRSVAPVPVVTISPATTTRVAGDRERGRARIDAGDETVFLFVFDFWSVPERKNALAVIDAFNQAFTPEDSARLVIKCMNSAGYPEYFALMEQRAQLGRITLYDGYWSAADVQDLMAASDVYVSLHRSEGMGLTLFEAMSLGKPVIATGWSGNMDFMSADNSYPVEYQFVPLDQDYPPYRAGQIWADPSVDNAAALMRRVFEHPEESAAIGCRAQRDVLAQFSPSAVGQTVADRLAQIEDRVQMSWHGGSRTARSWRRLVAQYEDDPFASFDPEIHELVQTDLGPLVVHRHDTVIAYHLWAFGQWDPDESRVLRLLLRPGMTVVDVGANIGYFTSLCAQAVGPAGRVIAIEPEPRNFALLQANIALHRLKNVDPLQIAAGNAAGTMTLYLNPINSGDHRGFRVASDQESVPVQCARLDDLLDPGDRIDVVKIDVQGMDHEVVEGLSRTIERWRPTIVVEFFPEGILGSGASPQDVLALYRRLGYRRIVLDDPSYVLKEAEDNQLISALATSELRDPHCNILLRPVETPKALGSTTACSVKNESYSDDVAIAPERLIRPQFLPLVGELSQADESDVPSLTLAITDVGEIWTNARDESVGALLRSMGVNEPEEGAFLRRQLRPGMTVIDVGANIGYFTRMMAEAVGPTGRVLALEPEPTNFSTLLENLKLGTCGNVTPVRCAAGDTSRWQSLTVIESLHGGHFLSNGAGGSAGRVEVQVLPLDELLNPDAPIDFIKIDIEGFDHLAVAGLRRTLHVHKPLVLVEFYPGAIRRAGFEPGDILRGYREMGLQIAHELAPDEPLDVDDDTFVSMVDRGEMYGGSQAHTNLILRASDVDSVRAVPSGVTWMTEAEWRPLLQRAIDALDEGRLEEGRATCLALLSDGALPWDVREVVYLNQTSYARSLADLVPGVTKRRLTWPVAKGAIRREPSPVVLGDRLLAVARVTLPSPDVPRRDVLLTLDDGLRVADSVTLRDETGLADRFDDVRPFALDGKLYAAVILYDAEAEEWTQAGIVAIEDGVYRDLHCLGPRAGYFHGGWAPVATPSGARVIAWWEPTEVMRFDPLPGTFARESVRFAPRVTERFWAGSQGVAIPGGCLVLVNEEVAATEDDAQIFSRFVHLDQTWQVTAVSPQFFVSQPGEDVASGLALHGDRLIAGFTVGNRAALLASMDLAVVLATLTPVPAPGRALPRSEVGD